MMKDEYGILKAYLKGENQRVERKSCTSTFTVHHSSHMECLGVSQGLSGKKSKTNPWYGQSKLKPDLQDNNVYSII
jgi:hypothetical protein